MDIIKSMARCNKTATQKQIIFEVFDGHICFLLMNDVICQMLHDKPKNISKTALSRISMFVGKVLHKI